MRPLALVPLLVLFAAPAAAQEVNADSLRLEMLGTAPSACVIAPPTVSNASNASYAEAGPNSGQVVIGQFVDPQTANPLASSIDLALPVTCNSSHRLTVRSGNGGLLRQGGNPAQRQAANRFADFVTYSLTVDWAGQALVARTDGAAIELVGADARTGEVGLRIATPAGGGPLTAGRFDDTIVVEFSAAN